MPLFVIKARSPLGDRQCDEQEANQDSDEIYYKYTNGRKKKGSGVFVRKLILKISQ
jgi:hypothetical protein